MSYGTSNQGIGLRWKRTVPIFFAMLGTLFALLAVGSTSAQAEEVGFEFDRGVINLNGPNGLWPPLIDPTIPDPPATLNTEVAADGTLTAPAENFNFPVKKIEDLDVTEVGQNVLFFVDANIQITAEGPITGDFDTATGASDVTIPADVLITVYQANSPSAVARCRVDGFDLNLSTDEATLSDPGDPAAVPPRSAAEYDSAVFDPSANSEGAMIATWTSLPGADTVSGSLGSVVCPALDDMLGGTGGVWMEGVAGTGVDTVIPPPAQAPKITGTPSSSTASTSAEFMFEKVEAETNPVTGFRCKLDAGDFAACDSGTQSYAGLAEGSHSFEVKAVNGGGEGPVASFSWTVTGATTPTGEAKLGPVKIAPKSKSVKRGKKATFTASVKNTGGAATGVKVCVSAPKKLIKVKKCVTVGQIAAGKTKTAKFKVTVTKKAKKGKKIALSFKVTSANAGTKSGKATVKVK